MPGQVRKAIDAVPSQATIRAGERDRRASTVDFAKALVQGTGPCV